MNKYLTRAEDGYTMIELVVVLVLLGIIAEAVAGGLHFGARVWERSQSTMASSYSMSMNQTVLRELLSHAFPRFKGEFLTFSGGRTQLAFDGAPPEAFAGGTTHVTLSIVPGNEGDSLALKLQSVSDPSLTREVVLSKAIPGLRLSYLDNSGRTTTWLATWRDRARLPDAIRITSDDPSVWPELIVHPIVAQDANCALDPVSMTCRRT